MCEYGFKNNLFNWNYFLLSNSLLVLKSTSLHNSLPKIPTLVGPKRQFKKFVLTLSNCIEIFCFDVALTLF